MSAVRTSESAKAIVAGIGPDRALRVAGATHGVHDPRACCPDLASQCRDVNFDQVGVELVEPPHRSQLLGLCRHDNAITAKATNRRNSIAVSSIGWVRRSTVWAPSSTIRSHISVVAGGVRSLDAVR